MAKAKRKHDFGDITKYAVGDEKYVFPFTLLDPTPGGTNLGRIEWCVELHPARKRRGEGRIRIGEVWLWAKQTRDARYAGKVFKFETIAETLGTERLRNAPFTPWRTGFCAEHRGALTMEAYPPDGADALIVEANSSISFDVSFMRTSLNLRAPLEGK